MGQRCDSCGMPLKQDPAGGGTEADGSRSAIYCSYCYADGDFLIKDVSVKEYQSQVVENMVANGHARWKAWLLTREIPRRPRWKNS